MASVQGDDEADVAKMCGKTTVGEDNGKGVASTARRRGGEDGNDVASTVCRRRVDAGVRV